MDLVFYKTDDGDNVINKTLTDPLAVPINARRDFSIYSPVIDLLDGGMNLRQYNYCIITELNRCYFIDNMEIIGSDILRVSLNLDVLETHKADILNSYAKYRRKVGAGDYGEITIDGTGKKIVTNHYSDTTLEVDDKAIISVMGGFYG